MAVRYSGRPTSPSRQLAHRRPRRWTEKDPVMPVCFARLVEKRSIMAPAFLARGEATQEGDNIGRGNCDAVKGLHLSAAMYSFPRITNGDLSNRVALLFLRWAPTIDSWTRGEFHETV